MQNLTERLEKRGWKKEEIQNAVNSIKSAKQNKSRGMMFLEKRMYWLLLIIIAVSNFAVSMAIIPILMALAEMALYFAIIVLGLSFGFLFELVIRGIEHLEKRHHAFLAVFIPITAFLIVYFMAELSNKLMLILGLKNFHASAIIAFAYAASFAVPYIVYRFVMRKEYYAIG